MGIVYMRKSFIAIFCIGILLFIILGCSATSSSEGFQTITIDDVEGLKDTLEEYRNQIMNQEKRMRNRFIKSENNMKRMNGTMNSLKSNLLRVEKTSKKNKYTLGEQAIQIEENQNVSEENRDAGKKMTEKLTKDLSKF